MSRAIMGQRPAYIPSLIGEKYILTIVEVSSQIYNTVLETLLDYFCIYLRHIIDDW